MFGRTCPECGEKAFAVTNKKHVCKKVKEYDEHPIYFHTSTDHGARDQLPPPPVSSSHDSSPPSDTGGEFGDG